MSLKTTAVAARGVACVVAIVALAWPLESLAYKPKTHIYLALQSIARIDECKVDIDGTTYDVDTTICEAIKNNKADYLGGAVGPDGFPDLTFGQGVIHPDTRCTYNTSDDGDCSAGNTDTWALDWTEHLWRAAYSLSGVERQRAIAFTVGFMTHAAGDMWAHTFVNRFAGGVWPEFADVANLDIALRHVIVEGVVGEHTPDITHDVSMAGGLNAPTGFIYDVMINDRWARHRAAGSFIGMVYKLRGELETKRGDPPTTLDWVGVASGIPTSVATVVRYHYLNCWIKEIDSGLKEWPNVSLKVANAMFVAGQTDLVWDPYLKDFRDNHLVYMIGNPTAPDQILARCGDRHSDSYKIYEVITHLANPAGTIMDAVGDIDFVNPLQPIFNGFKEFMFKALTGQSYDEFMDMLKEPSNFLQAPLFPAPTAAADSTAATVMTSLKTLMNLDSQSVFSNATFNPAANTILLGKLAMMNSGELNDMLARYNVGTLFGNTSTAPPEMSENAALGFMRSLDGNHQWRDNAPPLPITEPERRFGQGMLLYKDCLARRNFFKRVFGDWSHDGAPTVYYDESEEECEQITNLSPVTMTVEVIGEGVGDLGDSGWLAPGCGTVALRIRLTNHQVAAQDYALFITDDIDLPIIARRAQVAFAWQQDLRLCNSTAPSVGRLYHRVLAGQLPAIPTTGPNGLEHTKELVIPLPTLGGTSHQYRVYLLEKMISTKLPVVTNNPTISRNAAEFLTLPIDPVDITLTVAIPTKPPKCVPSPPDECQAGAATWLIPAGPVWKWESTGVCQPPESFICDADRDSAPNEADNCPVTANPNQGDIDLDGVGDACDPINDRILRVIKDWLEGKLPDPKFMEAIRRYPFLFENPNIDVGGGALPGWSPRYSLTSTVFKEYSRAYINGKVTLERYMATMQVMFHGATYRADAVRVTGAQTQISSKQQSIRLQLDAKDGGRIELRVPRLVIDGPGAGPMSTFSLRTVGAPPGKVMESANRDYRMFDLRLNPGTTELVLDRRP